MIAFLIIFSSNLIISVWIGYLLGGGVVIMERSLAEIKLNCNVLGIGVAVKVKTSTFTFKFLSFSLTDTPNFYSSSTINKPKSLKRILFTIW